MTSRLRDQKWFQRAVVWGALALCWEIIGASLGPGRFPRFSEVVIGVVAGVTNGDLVTLLGTLGQMVAGFGLAALIGIPTGLLMGRVRSVEYLLRMYFNALFVTSLEALVPLLIVFFGMRFGFRVMVVFLFSMPYIVLNTATGVRTVSHDLLEMAAAFCASQRQIFVKVILPGALPYLVAGLRLGLGSAIKGAIVAEFWVVVGTGARLIELGENHSLAELCALTFWIIVMVSLANRLLQLVQISLLPWSRDLIGLSGQERRE